MAWLLAGVGGITVGHAAILAMLLYVAVKLARRR